MSLAIRQRSGFLPDRLPTGRQASDEEGPRRRQVRGPVAIAHPSHISFRFRASPEVSDCASPQVGHNLTHTGTRFTQMAWKRSSPF